MFDDTFDIQKLVAVSGVPRRTIYFYVQQELLQPPLGAGLAAYYTGDHLLRLRLIPILRKKGLRLDDIREKFRAMSREEMLQQISESAKPEHRDQAEEVAGEDGLPFTPVMQPIHDTLSFPEGRSGQKYLHFAFPGGITLIAPASLSIGDQKRLQLLLQAAERIFSIPAGNPVTHEPANSGGRPNSPGEGEYRI